MRAFAFFLLGAVLGGGAASWAGPKFVHWYAQPPFAMGCDCGPAMNWAMGKLVIFQGIGGALGAISLLVLAFVFGRRSGKKLAATATT